MCWDDQTTWIKHMMLGRNGMAPGYTNTYVDYMDGLLPIIRTWFKYTASTGESMAMIVALSASKWLWTFSSVDIH